MRPVFLAVLIGLSLVAGSLVPKLVALSDTATPVADAQSAPGAPSGGPKSDVQVCDAAVPIGYARCHSRLRTDSEARGGVPLGIAATTPPMPKAGGPYDPTFL